MDHAERPPLEVHSQPALPGAEPMVPAGTVLTLRFGGKSGVQRRADALDIRVGLDPLAGTDRLEYWTTGEPVETGVHGDLVYARGESFLLGCWSQAHTPEDDPDAATETAYREILAACDALGFRYLTRVWNYLPAINAPHDGLERYRAFCAGRARVFEAMPAFENILPAATAIGMHRDGLLIYFVATDRPAERIENPRQVSAFRYPRQYGPRSPSFARASLWYARPDSAQLFISGTASIVGHESWHAGDLEAQLDESLRNVEAVLAEAAAGHPIASGEPGDLALLKVYLRDPEQAQRVLRHLRARVGERVAVMILHGDICRSELLVEVEGHYAPGPRGPG
ncbi:MAG: hypothetical protein ACQETK_11220 [Pseudomonadota bacterium]